ncbi:MAG: hypothetical protein ACREQY_01840 [Candidatus Binatia bacterium]
MSILLKALLVACVLAVPAAAAERQIEFGIQTPPEGTTWEELLETWLEAERLGVRNLGDQAVGVEAAEETSDLSRLLERIGGEADRRVCELAAQVAVGKAVERMLATEQRLEEHAVVARERVEGAHGSAVGT